ncbi:MAG: hypothetical protein HYT46_00965, partial [Candidatus Vogelbacteria bacterium]|nr:hypothetical protein [Candidatus Vogelbacteria bacterium]
MAKNIVKDTLSFKPKIAVRTLVAFLPDRAQDILKKRFGLEDKERMTLDAIGQKYGITRERVRQIEEFSLRAIRRSGEFTAAGEIFSELRQSLHDYGGIAHEREFLKHLDADEVNQNNLHFLLVLGNEFTRLKEDEEFHHRWTIDNNLAERVHQLLRQVAAGLKADDLLSEDEMVERVLAASAERLADEGTTDKARRWLLISKQLGLNPVGEWGLASSPNVRVRGVRDYAFLILRQHGSPMHFMEVAKAISDSFERRANPATCHN